MEAELCLTRLGDGVGKVSGIVGLIIEVAVIAEQRRHTGALGVKGGDVEGRAVPDQRLGTGGVDKRLRRLWEVDVVERVYSMQLAEIDGVSHLRLLGIVLLEDIIAYVAAEIAVRTQQFGGHLCTKPRIDATHKHRSLAERLSHPLGEACVRIVEGIIYPQAVWQQTYGAAAEEGAVGFGGKGCLHLLTCGIEVVGWLIVDILGGLESDEQLVVLRHRGGGGAGCKERKREYDKYILVWFHRLSFIIILLLWQVVSALWCRRGTCQ